MLEQRLKYVKVTNKFDTPYVDMFDGVPVTIDAGGSQNIQPEQAYHFFGYVEGASKQQMLLHVAKRQGWNTSKHLERDDSGKTLAERMFDKLVIEPVTFRLVEETTGDPDAPIPAEASGDDANVETAPPPPRFTPRPSQAKGKAAAKRADDDE